MGFEANSDKCKWPVRLLEREQKRALACSLGTRADLETASTQREALALSRPQKALCLQAPPRSTPCHWQPVLEKKCMLGNSKKCKKSPNTSLLPQPTISTITVDAGGGRCSQLGTHIGSQGASAEPKGLTPEVLMSLSRKEPRN